jgi:UDP-N-acetylmuramate dehydrogenase
MMAALDVTNLRGELQYYEPMSKHTSWRVGGPARQFYRPADSQDLALFLGQLPADEPLFWMGLGSNLLVRDEGFDGTVIATLGVLEAIQRLDSRRLRVEAGASCARVARISVREGLSGIEYLAGIPGTMGGALAMNAGAFGGETWELVAEIETMNRFGHIRNRDPDDFEIGYRRVIGPPGEWFLAAVLELRPGDTLAGQQEIRRLLERRSASQPVGLPSCGSVFRNPQGDFAARLIENAGLKGYCIGGACVSEKHANFIVNTGPATATDIEQLINKVRQVVAAQSGIELQTEVRILGQQGMVQ